MTLVPELFDIWHNRIELVNTIKMTSPILSSITSLDQVKVAIIEAGVEDAHQPSFPAHTDTFPDSGRNLSITIYFNEEISVKEGASLRVYPFLAEDAIVDISPSFGRMVLFSSCNLFHRVLPSTFGSSDRFCLSLMFYGNDTLFPYQSTDTAGMSTEVSMKISTFSFERFNTVHFCFYSIKFSFLLQFTLTNDF